MGSGSVLTGLSIYKPVQFGTLTSMLGGYEWARIEHFTLTILFTLFFLVHIIQVVFAGWNNFQSMITGLFILKDEQKNLAASPITVEVNSKSEEDTIYNEEEDTIPPSESDNEQ
jgi:hypothetical protein